MLENKGSEEEFLKQADVMISMDSFWASLQKLIGTMERFKRGSCRGQVHNHTEALGKAETLVFLCHILLSLTYTNRGFTGGLDLGPGISSATQGGVCSSPENISINLLRGQLWQLLAN